MARISLVQQYDNKNVIKQIADLRKEVESIEGGSTEGLTERVEALEDSVDTLEDSIGTIEDSVDTLQDSVDALPSTYQPKSERVTSIGSAPDNAHYPTAKAVYDYDKENDASSVQVTTGVTVQGGGGVTVAVALKNSAGTTIATGSGLIPTDLTLQASGLNPVQSRAVYAIERILNETKDRVTALETDMADVPTVYQERFQTHNILLEWTTTSTHVNITDLAVSDLVLVSPIETSRSDWMTYGIRAIQVVPGSLWFMADSVPPNDTYVNVTVFKGLSA